ncbi:MAG: peptide deformylase [Proteobacteria bacterium]|nr:peptide deformylase [Pseudomonadota bacterium]
MPIRQIAKMGHPVLRMRAEEVLDPTDPEIARLVEDMRDTLVDIVGSGIAAPQIYDSRRVILYRIEADRIPEGSSMKALPWTVMINPVLTMIGGEKRLIWERCLSLPGLHGKVPRHTKVHISFQTLAGDTVAYDADGWHAMILQHEYDHLDGILYPMRMDDITLLSFNAEPGPLTEDVARDKSIDPMFQKLAASWTGRHLWLPETDGKL